MAAFRGTSVLGPVTDARYRRRPESDVDGKSDGKDDGGGDVPCARRVPWGMTLRRAACGS